MPEAADWKEGSERDGNDGGMMAEEVNYEEEMTKWNNRGEVTPEELDHRAEAQTDIRIIERICSRTAKRRACHGVYWWKCSYELCDWTGESIKETRTSEWI